MDLKTFVDSDWSNGSNLLHFAVKSNNIELVKEVLKYKVNIHNQNDYGSTALFGCKNNEILKLLIDEGIDPNIQCDEGRTALFDSDNFEKVKLLLDAGIDPNITDNSNDNALTLFFKYLEGTEYDEYFKIINALIPLTNLDHNHGQSLRIFLKYGRLEIDILQSLISGMKNMNSLNRKGNSFLHDAAKHKYYWSEIELLIRSGVNMDVENKEGKDFYDLGHKDIQEFIQDNYLEFMEFKELRNTSSKFNI